jgi:large subunit ribosomal protein L18
MNFRNTINKRYTARKKRTRAKISGTKERPRVSVFRSNRGLFIQFIDDAAGHTLASASAKELGKTKANKSELAQKLGVLAAKKAVEAGITKAVFDKGAYKYHGRIKAVSDALRANGIHI